MAGMAAGDAPGAHPRATEEPVALDGLLRVARAGRLVAAARRQPAEGEPVGMDQRDAHALQDSDVRHPRPALISPPCSPSTPLRARSRPSAAPSARRSAPTIARLAITTTSQPGRS